jgi:uncharacterized DUF497 family protein
VEFRWNDWNVEHIREHGIAATECESVVCAAQSPFPKYVGDGKWLVWGRGQGGRFIQVVYLVDPDDTAFVVHARLLSEREKARYRKTRRQ